MDEKVNILGVSFDNITMAEATKNALSFLNGRVTRTIYTANPEIVMEAQKDSLFLEIINNGDLVVADGIGVVIGSKIIRNPLYERVAGYDLVQNIFDSIKYTDKTVYFFGAAPDIAKEAASNMMKEYPGLQIIGAQDGYFDEDKEKIIIEEINQLRPDLLLVGLGAPKQEKWINDHINNLQVKLIIGVGGSFDGMSGHVKRAPNIFIKLGLEWFYRLLNQPTRIFRMIKLPLFLLKVVFKGKNYQG